MPVIQAESVFKVFGKRPERALEPLRQGASRQDLMERGLVPAVIDASFDVEAGEIFVVMGLSGSGKSTLIRMVNGASSLFLYIALNKASTTLAMARLQLAQLEQRFAT